MRNKSLLQAALAALAVAPIMKHMREIAYTPVSLKEEGGSPDRRIAAEAKRLRKQARNIKNAQAQQLQK